MTKKDDEKEAARVAEIKAEDAATAAADAVEMDLSGVTEVETRADLEAKLARASALKAQIIEVEADITAAIDKLIDEETAAQDHGPHKTTRDIRGYLDGQLAAMEKRAGARTAAAKVAGVDLAALKPTPLEAHLSTRKPAPRSTQVKGTGKE